MQKQTFDTISSAEKRQFQQQVLSWYKENKRDLPWRKTSDPYKILVSEVMLQQTQVPRVIQKFTARMDKRPTVFSLAQASRQEVLKERSGLGFNRRAINLHEACKKIAMDAIVDAGLSEDSSKSGLSYNNRTKGEKKTQNPSKILDFQQTSHKMLDKCGKVMLKNMQDYAYLRALPGVGEYTANAILAFAYNFEVLVLDINIKRVLIHTFGLPQDISQFDLQSIALSLVPLGRSREWHNALMDYGSMVLHSKATGIQSPKQSQFKGSDREVRGRILKQLVGNTGDKAVKGSQQQSLLKKLPKENLRIVNVQAQFPTKDIQKIIARMEKEGIVRTHNGKVILG